MRVRRVLMASQHAAQKATSALAPTAYATILEAMLFGGIFAQTRHGSRQVVHHYARGQLSGMPVLYVDVRHGRRTGTSSLTPTNRYK